MRLNRGLFQINCSTIKDKCDINELANKFVYEKTRLKSQGSHSIKLVSQRADIESKLETNKFKKKKNMSVDVSNDEKKKRMTDKCYFYKRVETL